MLREVLAAREKTLGAGHPEAARTLTALGRSLLEQRKWPNAGPILRRALAIWDAERPDNWSRFETRSLLGESLLGQKKYAESKPLVLSGSKGLPAVASDRVVRLYEAWGKPEKAAEWRTMLTPTPAGAAPRS